MKAAVWYGRNDVRIEDRPEPQVTEGKVKIRVKWCGICGSDVYEYTNGPFIIPTNKPHPLTGKMAPIIMGHEFSGVAVEVGKGVSHIRPGDHVGIHACIICNECYWCKKGIMNFCLKLGSTGLCDDGGFAEYALVPGYACYKLPENVSFEAGSFVEPISVAIHAAKRGQIGPGSTVAVIGTGPIGLLVLKAAKAAGASQIYAIEKLPHRREVAKIVGATEVFDPEKTDPGKEIHQRTEGIRVDVSFDCAGGETTLTLAHTLTRRGGKIVNVALPKTTTFRFDRLFLHEKDIITAYAYVDESPAAVAYLSDGRMNCDPLITGKIKLKDLVEEGFHRLLEGKSKHIKILVSPEL